MLVFGFFVMILGTYANLGAMDEQQSIASIPIDRLPDIHVTIKPTDNILMPPSKVSDVIGKVEMGPLKLADTVFEEEKNKIMAGKRKVPKTTKLMPVAKNPIREINLNGYHKEKEEIAVKKPQKKDPIVQKIEENIAPSVNSNEKLAAAPDAPKPNNVPIQLAEPSIDKKSFDSAINNEAIKKEDQEIEIDADEKRLSDAKRTKEILDVVKKQNEDTQKLVLERIHEISEKVNNIAQMHNRSVAQQMELPLKKEIHTHTPVNGKDTGKNELKSANVDEVQSKKLPPLPPVPVVKLLSDRKSSSAPVQLNVVAESEPEIKQKKNIVDSEPQKSIINKEKEPERKEEKTKENVGRDLLSDSNDLRINNVKSGNAKTEN